MRFELHCHSTESDGTDAPANVVRRAEARSVEVFAITDHDTCTGLAMARGHSLRGVEISCDEVKTGRTLHVLAYDRGGAGWAELETRLGALQEARRNRLRVMGVRLETRGIKIDVDAMIAGAHGRSVGRPDLARAMVAAGHVTSMKEAFSRHLFDGGPVDVPHHALPLPEALELGRAAGAAMSLAHPHLYDHLGVELLKRHHADGLGGVEAYYGAYDPRERARWIELADEVGLVCTGGSDSHSPDDNLGVDLPADRSAQLVEWLALSGRSATIRA
ncbi:MAG: PHP domain-containing protein [Kofleriaceae bacterium]